MVFENRILRRIFGPKRDAIWECRGLQNEEFHSLNIGSSPNAVRAMKSRKLRLPGYVARMEEGRCGFKILICSIKETFRKT